MKDDNKTNKQLVVELTELRSQNAALKKSEDPEKYRSLVEYLRDVVYELDSQGVVLYISPAIKDLLGYDSTDIVGKNFIELAHKDDLSHRVEWFSELRKGVESPSEYRIIDKSGEYKWAQTRVRPIMEDGQFKGGRGILLDVTKQRQAIETLRESEEKYRRVFENSIMGISQTLRDGRLITINNAYAKMYGYANAEEMMAEVSSVGPLYADPEEREDVLRILTEKGVMEPREITVIRRDGTRFTVLAGTREIRDFKGNLLYYQAEQIDITKRKRAEMNLKESKELTEAVVENVPLMIFLKEAVDLRFVIFNRAGEELLGYDRKDLLGKNDLNLFPPEQAAHFMAKDREVLDGESGILDIPEEPILTAKKGTRRLHTRKVCIKGADGVTKYLLGISEDITERKRAEEFLRESENKYRLLADNVNDVIFVLDMNLKYSYVSPSVKILRGYEPEEVLKQQPSEILAPSSLDLAMRTLSEIMELEKSKSRDLPVSKTLQLEMIRKDGTTVWTEVKFSFIRDNNQRAVGILGLTRDITERKQAEKQLQDTLESLRKAVGATIQVMVSAVEARDPYTSGHQARSADLARAIAIEMGLPKEKIEGIRMAGSIHDIGKLSIPAEILSKPTKLSEIEFALIKEHAHKGFEMLKDVESPWPLAEIVYQHHERMDGSGYPRNLKGEEILMEARMLAVADVVESMASHRPYRPALGIEAALEEIEKNKGILYDEAVADACCRLFRKKGFQLAVS